MKTAEIMKREKFDSLKLTSFDCSDIKFYLMKQKLKTMKG